jgi:hypothetical protein
VTRNNLIRLQRLTTMAASRLSGETATPTGQQWSDSYILLACLRILKCHVSRLVLSGVEPSFIGISVPGIERPVIDEKKAIRIECDRVGFREPPTELEGQSDEGVDEDGIFDITALKSFLLSLVGNDDKSALSSTSRIHDDARSLLQQEAIDFLRIGINLFYPTPSDKVALVEYLLNSSDKSASLLAPSLLDKLSDDVILNSLIPHAPVKPKFNLFITNIDKSKTATIDIAVTQSSSTVYLPNLSLFITITTGSLLINRRPQQFVS